VLTGILLALASFAQAPANAQETRILERFRDLPAEEQSRITGAIWAAALALEHPCSRSAARLAQHPRVSSAPTLDPDLGRAFAAAEFAPALGLKTKTWQPSDNTWRLLHRSFFGQRRPPPPAADLWAWDPGRDSLIRPGQPPTPELEVLAALRGTWFPDARLRAWALGALDAQAELNPVADYFEHAYRNRDGGVYAGIRLWDVWDSGRTFEISDVEAIAWLRAIGGDSSTVSPIPGTRHLEIYARIKDSFAGWREHWTLRQALAARMLAPWERPDPLFAGAADALDAAWVLCEHDPERMNAWLAAHPSRDAFLASIAAESARLRQLPETPASWTAGWEARASLQSTLADSALTILRDEGLLGISR
jgi:hypothetical protein